MANANNAPPPGGLNPNQRNWMLVNFNVGGPPPRPLHAPVANPNPNPNPNANPQPQGFQRAQRTQGPPNARTMAQGTNRSPVRQALVKRATAATAAVQAINARYPALGAQIMPQVQAALRALQAPEGPNDQVLIGTNLLLPIELALDAPRQLLKRLDGMQKAIDGVPSSVDIPEKAQAQPIIAQLNQALTQGNILHANARLDNLQPLLPKLVAGTRRKAISDELTRNFQAVGRVAFVQGEAQRSQAKLDPMANDMPFTTLIADCARLENWSQRSPQNLAQAETSARNVIQGIQAKGKNATEEDRQKATFAKDRITQARMLAMSRDYGALGPVANWDDAAEAKASKIQAEYFFEEGVMLAKDGDYGAKPLKPDQGGVNGAWWIKRVDPAYRGGDEKSLSIFKPADAEAIALGGYSKGSGAAREVMAKTLSDKLMAYTGYDVGVCPTTIAEIDSTKLPDNDGNVSATPTRIGSMQQLAPNKGEVADLYDPNHSDHALLAKVPKENLDQIALFDLITGASDRHGKNLLMAQDANGNGQLVPIDHGYTMPDADGLLLNRRRGADGHNALLDPALDVNGAMNQPLSATARQGLLAMNPAQIEADMRASRDALAQANPNLNHDVADANIAVMRRTIEFLQAAARANLPQPLTTAELFRLSARFAPRIYDPAVQTAQLPALVVQLATEYRAGQAAQPDIDLIDSGQGSFPYNSTFQDLGWCLALPPSGVKTWVHENQVLAARILKCQLVNPALQAEINAMIQRLGGLPEARELVPDIDKLTIPKQYENLKSAFQRREQDANKKFVAGKDVNDLQELYDRLGGDDRFNELVRVFPGDGNLDGLAPVVVMRSKIQSIRNWVAFQAEGGVAEYTRLGFPYTLDGSGLENALEQFRWGKLSHQGSQGLSQMSDLQVAQAQQAAANHALANAQQSYANLPAPGRQVLDQAALVIQNAALAGAVDAVKRALEFEVKAKSLGLRWRKLDVARQTIALLPGAAAPNSPQQLAYATALNSFDTGDLAQIATANDALDNLLKT